MIEVLLLMEFEKTIQLYDEDVHFIREIVIVDEKPRLCVTYIRVCGQPLISEPFSMLRCRVRRSFRGGEDGHRNVRVTVTARVREPMDGSTVRPDRSAILASGLSNPRRNA
jgi:hypothetical protein